ncbi:MAG: tetratricopeptide repeat protein [Myxococcales bacterium]|nr:tetratricopeptide repeat protein [Myxococcales bacterium]
MLAAFTAGRLPSRLFTLCALMLILSTAAPSCVTVGKFNELQSRVVTLEKQYVELDERNSRDMQRLENLNSLLKQAKDGLQRDSANLLATLEEISQRSRDNAGSIEEIRFQLEKNSSLVKQLTDFIDRRFGESLSVLPTDLPKDAEGLFQAGVTRMKSKQTQQARAIFRQYLDKFGTETKAADAQFYVGETYFLENTLDSAMTEYQAVYTNYRAHARAPEGLLRIGEALVLKKDCVKAKQVWDLLVKEFPKSPHAATAKERTKSLKDLCKP